MFELSSISKQKQIPVPFPMKSMEFFNKMKDNALENGRMNAEISDTPVYSI